MSKKTLGAVIALTLFPAIVWAQPATLTLACSGTASGSFGTDKPEPYSMGLMLRFSDGAVQGFTLPGQFDVPVKITAANDAVIAFGGVATTIAPTQTTISGSLDRITGDLSATEILFNTQSQKAYSTTQYELKCRPTQRIF